MNYYNITFRRLLIGMTLILGLSGALSAQEVPMLFSKTPLTHTFNTHDYQGGIQNWGIVQDRRGLIYVANNFSLLEYDGQHWKRNDVENNTRVRSVFVDQDNRIYIGGQNQFGYFEPGEAGRLVFTSLASRIPAGSAPVTDIWKIFRHEDAIYFNSYNAIFTYKDDQLEQIKPEIEIDLLFHVAHQIYFFSPSEGIGTLSNGQARLILGSRFLTSSAVTAILPAGADQILIFQKDGHIYRHSPAGFEEWKVPAATFLRSALINTAITLKNNHIAIGTQNNGLVILSPSGQTLRHLTKGKGLNNRTVLCLFEDRFNNLWVGLNNGISLVELSSPFSLIDEQSGLPGTGYSVALHQNGLYLGTSNGLFYQKTNADPLDEETRYRMVANTQGQVYNLNKINDDLYLAHHNGAFLVEGEAARPIFSQQGVWKMALMPDREHLLTGTYEGFYLFSRKGKEWVNPQPVGTFRESSRVFEFENDSTLWMTHGYKGVYKIAFSAEQPEPRIVFYGDQKGFPANILINVFDIGNKLVFPAQNGIFEYAPASDRFVHVGELEQEIGYETHVSAITRDGHGGLYFMATDALGHLAKDQFGEYQRETARFRKIVKYLSDDLENITVVDHHNVFFGAKDGFIHYDPGMPHTRNDQFTTYIRRIEGRFEQETLLYGGHGDIPKENTFPSRLSTIRFQFAAPYFDGSEDLEYQYLLENFDQNWSEWSAGNEKEYTNLSGGQYIFRVRARNVYGELSSEATFTFRMMPPWYQSNLAYTGYAMGLLLIFGLSMLLLDKKHRTERKILTINQKRELIRKENEIELVSKKSEAEISRLRNEKLTAEVDHKNRELATTTMHLINKNEFMLTLKESLQQVSKNGKDTKEALRKIVRDIDRNLQEDEGWEQFTRHFDQVHGSFLKSIKAAHPTLTPQEIKLCAYLRMNMSSKEIANLLNISVRGVEISRYRLRKKLDINRDKNLVDYMMEF